MRKKILLIVQLLLGISLGLSAQLFEQENYLAFKSSEWKGVAAPNLLEIKIEKSPLHQSYLFYDTNGKSLNGRYHIIIHNQKYVLVDLAKGQINGGLSVFHNNQEIERYHLKNGIYEGEQSFYLSNETYTYNKGVLTHYVALHNNGQLKREINYVNGKINGLVAEYNSQGKILGSKQYINGVLNGEATYLNNQGYTTKSIYVNGKLNGAYQEVYKDGQIAIEGVYKDDQKTGVWVHYQPNGELKEKSEYVNGKYNGLSERYSLGSLYESVEYVNGERHGKRLYFRGTPPKMWLSKEENYSNGKLNGVVKNYNEKGVLYFEGEYKQGRKEKGKEYHSTTGRIQLEAIYRDGRTIAERIYERDGILKYLRLQDERGNLVVVQEYNLKGEVTKKNPSYKKTASIKLIEDEWGIIDIP